jgi:hypothetical protein
MCRRVGSEACNNNDKIAAVMPFPKGKTAESTYAAKRLNMYSVHTPIIEDLTHAGVLLASMLGNRGQPLYYFS